MKNRNIFSKILEHYDTEEVFSKINISSIVKSLRFKMEDVVAKIFQSILICLL